MTSWVFVVERTGKFFVTRIQDMILKKHIRNREITAPISVASEGFIKRSPRVDSEEK